MHEAGHAVVALRLRLRVRETRFPTATDLEEVRSEFGPFARAGGVTVFKAPNNDLELLARKKPELMAMVMLAGTLAEVCILDRYLVDGAEGDMRTFVAGFDSEAEALDRLPELRRLAEWHVAESRPVIERVAAALVTERRLDRRRLRSLTGDLIRMRRVS